VASLVVLKDQHKHSLCSLNFPSTGIPYYRHISPSKYSVGPEKKTAHCNGCRVQFSQEYVVAANACYHSVQNLLSCSLLSKNLKIKIYRTVILPVVLYGRNVG